MLSSLFGGIYGYIAAALLSAALAGFLSYDITHKIDLGTINAMRLADADAMIDATKQVAKLQQVQDSIALDAAVKEAQAQQKIVTQTVTVTKEITKHVTDTVPCVPYGAVRLLNDAATGSNTADAATAPGQSDGACAPVPWRDFVSDIISDYGIGRQNAEQLNALESNITNLVKAANQ